MNAIKEVALENFQSHSRTKLEPAPAGQLTVIVGPTDSGKTVIIRALRWLLFNVPQGTDFIRVGCTYTRVSVTLDGGVEVHRVRSSSRNQYAIVDPIRPVDQLQTFEGFGSTVPLEVRELLGTDVATVGDLELNLNLSEQLDPPFLGKSISATARAKILGKLAGTEEVDLANRNVGTDLYRAGQEVKRLDADIADITAKLDSFSWLPSLEQAITAVEALAADIRALQERRQRLDALRQRRLQLVAARDAAVKRAEALAAVPTAEALVLATENAAVQRHTLLVLAARHQAAQTGLDAAQQTAAKGARVGEAEVALAEAGAAAEQAARLREQRERIVALRLRRDAAAGALEQAKDTAARLAGSEAIVAVLTEASRFSQRAAELKAIRQRRESLLGQRDAAVRRGFQAETLIAVSMDEYLAILQEAGRCPVCGSEIHPEHLREVV